MKNETPADRLRIARKNAGFASAKDAAMRLGKSPVTYTAHENGGREYDRADCILYSRKFNVSPGWLMFGGEHGAVRPSSNTRVPMVDFNPTSVNASGRYLGDFADLSIETVANFAVDWWEVPRSYLQLRMGGTPDACFLTECPEFFARHGTDLDLRNGDLILVDAERKHSVSGTFLVSTDFLPEIHVIRLESRDAAGSLVAHGIPLVERKQPYNRPLHEIKIIGSVLGRVQRFDSTYL